MQDPICPYSASTNLVKLGECVDVTVSKKRFSIYKNLDNDLIFTWPRPLESEIGDYYEAEDYISHSDTNSGLFNKLYQNVRMFTLKNKVNLVSKYANTGKRLLDIGCGIGAFLNQAKQSGFSVTGIEPSLKARTIAKDKYNLDVFDSYFLEEIPKESQDIVTMWHVLEHVYDLKATIHALQNVLKTKGKAVIAVPNANSYEASIYNFDWAGYDVPRHLYHFTPKFLESTFLSNGFKLIHKEIMPFDPFYVCLLSEKIKTGKIRYITGFWNGFRSFIKGKKDTNQGTSLIYIFEKI